LAKPNYQYEKRQKDLAKKKKKEEKRLKRLSKKAGDTETEVNPENQPDATDESSS
jgi:hypothetical protein